MQSIGPRERGKQAFPQQDHGTPPDTSTIADDSPLGALDTLGEPFELMKCPTCQENTPDNWQPLTIRRGGSNSSHLSDDEVVTVQADRMHCAKAECRQLVVRIQRVEHEFDVDGLLVGQDTSTWIAYPRHARRPIDPLVTGHLRQDYEEAAEILDTSPRMSAVLARKIVADLLEEYSRLDQYSLADRIDAFYVDTSHPSNLRENLHYLREMGDLSAHTKKSDQLVVVGIDQTDAAWTLDVIDRLFDYFIVGPAKDKKVRDAMDKKIAAAGRKPVSSRNGAEE